MMIMIIKQVKRVIDTNKWIQNIIKARIIDIRNDSIEEKKFFFTIYKDFFIIGKLIDMTEY